MKLFYANTSSYSRKVRLLIKEKGLRDHLEMIACNPFIETPELLAANPIGKITTLILDDGTSLFSSQLIYRYLDQQGDKTLIPME